MTNHKTLAEAIERDRENGTPGPWEVDPHGIDDCMGDVWLREDVLVAENATAADACRIARLPDLETAYLELCARVQALEGAAIELRDDMLFRAEHKMDVIRGEQYRVVNAGNGAWTRFCEALQPPETDQ